MKTKACLISNPNHKTRKTKTKNDMCKTTRFYCKNETKAKRNYDKKGTQN
jgi:hypothetical protein